MNFVHEAKGRSIKEFKHNFNNQGKFIQVNFYIFIHSFYVVVHFLQQSSFRTTTSKPKNETYCLQSYISRCVNERITLSHYPPPFGNYFSNERIKLLQQKHREVKLSLQLCIFAYCNQTWNGKIHIVHLRAMSCSFIKRNISIILAKQLLR